MMSSKNNGFTASDIERYHSGKMSAEERHTLEKAALDDPFLADALDGYAFTSTSSADLANIQSRLNEKTNSRKVVPFFQKYKWLSVAALVLIIAGAGWLVVSISGKENDSFAVTKKKDQSVNDSNQNMAPSQKLNDSVNISSSAVNQPPSENNRAQTVLQLPETDKNSTTVKPQKQSNNNREVLKEKDEVVPAITAQTTAQNEIKSEKSLFKADKKDVARNNALVAEPKSNNVSAPYANKESNSNAAPASTQIRRVNTNDTIKDLNVVLQPLPADSSSMQEVIVVGYGTQKKSTGKYPHVVLGNNPNVIIDTLEPADGYESFDGYVTNNLKMPEEFTTKQGSGEVQLSFDVDKSGQPVNIAVEKSLCAKCDEEAVRLLKEGPKWKKKKNKKGKITIRF